MLRTRVAIFLLLALAGCDSQPTAEPFPHAKHVREHGITCLYCHAFAEKSVAAGLPSVKKCMDCHSFLNVQKTVAVQPLFEAWETQQPMRWVKHNDTPDHVTFPHQLHLRAGVACSECHGDVENDQLNPPLSMQQCVTCHEQRESQRNCSACHK